MEIIYKFNFLETIAILFLIFFGAKFLAKGLMYLYFWLIFRRR